MKEAPWLDDLNKIRRFETVDLVTRKGVISPERISLKNYPERRPAKAFNPTFFIDEDEEIIRLFVRIIPGYYMYVSLIVRIDLELNDILAGYVNFAHYPAEIVIGTDTKYDFWGAEDPRVQRIGDKWIMVYSGRTKWYMTMFTTKGMLKRVIPVVASSESGVRDWKKVGALTIEQEYINELESDKDVVFLEGKYANYVLHRPHFTNDRYITAIGKVSSDLFHNEELKEYSITDNYIAIKSADFEYKTGWSAPPIKVGNDEYLILAHGVDNDLKAYRVFALLLKEEKYGLKITAVTPYYIMEPSEMYEKYGDRPMTIFPCGNAKIDDSILITYGAADSFTAFGLIDLSTLLSVLDKNRID